MRAPVHVCCHRRSTELEFWRARLGRFHSLSEQLHTHESKVVLGVLGCVRSRAMRSWKALDALVRCPQKRTRKNRPRARAPTRVAVCRRPAPPTSDTFLSEPVLWPP